MGVTGQDYTSRACAVAAATWRSIHVTAANGMTTSLLPIAICLLCANLSQHIQVWPCPHLTLSESMTLGRTRGRKGKKEEKIRALTKTAAPGRTSETGQLEFIREQRQENIHRGSKLHTCNTMDLNLDQNIPFLCQSVLSELFERRKKEKESARKITKVN